MMMAREKISGRKISRPSSLYIHLCQKCVLSGLCLRSLLVVKSVDMGLELSSRDRAKISEFGLHLLELNLDPRK